MTLAAKLLVAGIVFFLIGVVARIVQLQQRSREIEKTLDYSKMKEWDDDEEN
ncbi:MAG: hypothetical protein HKN70_10035 [Gammaproteobacteria bacterium]|nr:hypothetical protein [Gammaproteobacteria bacterium]